MVCGKIIFFSFGTEVAVILLIERELISTQQQTVVAIFEKIEKLLKQPLDNADNYVIITPS